MKNENKVELGNEIVGLGAVKKHGKDILKEVADVVVKTFLKEGLLKSSGIMNVISSMVSMRKGISDAFFEDKLKTFLENLSDVSQEDRDAFCKKLDSGKGKTTEQLFKHLVVVINKLEEEQKAEILANLFKLHIYGVIEELEFLRYASILNRVTLGDLMAIQRRVSQNMGLGAPTIEEFNRMDDELVQESLIAAGLLQSVTTGKIPEGETADHPENRNSYILTKTGQRLAMFMYYRDEYLDYWRKNGWEGFNTIRIVN